MMKLKELQKEVYKELENEITTSLKKNNSNFKKLTNTKIEQFFKGRIELFDYREIKKYKDILKPLKSLDKIKTTQQKLSGV